MTYFCMQPEFPKFGPPDPLSTSLKLRKGRNFMQQQIMQAGIISSNQNYLFATLETNLTIVTKLP